MRKIVCILASCALVAASGLAPVQAQTYPAVSKLTPFTQPSNYMSLPGYLRFRTLLETGRWISREQASHIVMAQLHPTAAITADSRDMVP